MLREFQWIEELSTNVMYNIGSKYLRKDDVSGLFERWMGKFNLESGVNSGNESEFPIYTPMITKNGQKVP